MYDQRCLGVYIQSNLLDRILWLHSYEPCPQDYCTNIQYNPQDKDVVNIATDWGDIIYDAWNQGFLTIHFLDSNSW